MSQIDIVSVQCLKNVLTVCFSSFSGSCSERENTSKKTVCVHTKQDFFTCLNISNYQQLPILLLHQKIQMRLMVKMKVLRQPLVMLWKYSMKSQFTQVRHGRMSLRNLKMRTKRILSRRRRRTWMRTKMIQSGMRWSIRLLKEVPG